MIDQPVGASKVTQPLLTRSVRNAVRNSLGVGGGNVVVVVVVVVVVEVVVVAEVVAVVVLASVVSGDPSPLLSVLPQAEATNSNRTVSAVRCRIAVPISRDLYSSS
jgi:hypothetical protein